MRQTTWIRPKRNLRITPWRGDELSSGWEAAIVAVGQEWTINLTVDGMNQGHFFPDLYPTEDKALEALQAKTPERAA